MDADSTGDAYARIVSRGYGLEVPDVLHPVKHLTEPWDQDLKKHVFEFVLHKDMDGDSDERIDRQKNEIKTYGPSPEDMKASKGETHTYRWKFKLDREFKASSNFCHIHQVKAGDGPDAGMPLMTITPRAGTPDKLELIFTAPTGASGSGKPMVVGLKPIKGSRVEAYEKVKYDDNGTFELKIRRVSDDSLLFNYVNPNTTIRYTLPEADRVRLTVVDLRGREVAVLADRFQEAGWYECFWNPVDLKGRCLNGGTYVAVLKTGSHSKTIKLPFLK